MKPSEQLIAKLEEDLALKRSRIEKHAASIDALADMLERAQLSCKIDCNVGLNDRVHILPREGTEPEVIDWLLQSGFVLTSKVRDRYDHCYFSHPTLSCGVTLLVPIPVVAEAA